ncbi:MAG TPA: S8 family peptidase [Vicinamibacterales bacterium]|nr:S8 family peptidase [Vicinamibacterales bacterium]
MKTHFKFVAVAVLVVSSGLGVRTAPQPHHALLSSDLLTHVERKTTARTRVIVHGDAASIDALAARYHVQVLRRLERGAVLAANSTELDALAADTSIDHLSGDVPIRTSMLVSAQAIAADQVRAGAPGLLGIGAIPGVTGQGIGVAVVDSGISAHKALANRVVANVSFVSGDPSVGDAYGHGTHVAGIITGSASAASGVTSLYAGGIAPGANLINVRVLGADGSGLTSDAIAGIEWAITNKAKYNIRVINISFGHPVMEPSATDPLCEAVAEAVQAGIVVVAAAGNSGKSADGHMVLGSIVSPGNSPLALTVGALNTFGTVKRSDDAVASYSSRGPTRFDLAVKPDVAAPGNKIVSLQASNSYLWTLYPQLRVAGSSSNAYMTLSGTSMAAPMVSGGVALLLQGTPGLTVPQVKLAIQNGATFVNNGGLMGAGAGSVNLWASRKIAAAGLVANLLNTVVGTLGVTSSGASFWDNGTLGNRLYGGIGIRLLSVLEAPLVWLNPSLLKSGDLNLLGLLNPLRLIAPKTLQYGEIGGWTRSSSILWGDQIYDPSGQSILWGDTNTTEDNSILWGDSVTSPDPQ